VSSESLFSRPASINQSHSSPKTLLTLSIGELIRPLPTLRRYSGSVSGGRVFFGFISFFFAALISSFRDFHFILIPQHCYPVNCGNTILDGMDERFTKADSMALGVSLSAWVHLIKTNKLDAIVDHRSAARYGITFNLKGFSLWMLRALNARDHDAAVARLLQSDQQTSGLPVLACSASQQQNGLA
jgi:hypothetical protein